ncbi:SMI1/KNR4 family protein [Streptomyces sp. NPDC096339]|uniref:SMI1/KNR4 family protein n=1 Tax=Streptomyces sp. NPDC096339 TaxID=3366086 RepID=UPI00381D65C2
MELTQATVNDLLARLGPEVSHMYLPDDLDPQDLFDLLAGRYGTPRTLVLAGFTDPTVDESKGAALLAPFEDRAVTIRAWAYGDQWVGTGTARDADGAERPVLVVAHREVPGLFAVTPDEDADGGADADQDVNWMERLIRITGWTQPARRPDVDWAEMESRLGTALPSDYKRMVETFGHGAFDGFLDLNQEPWTDLREDGLLIWAGTEHENLYCWRADGDDPDLWPVVIRSFDGEDVAFDCQAAEFVCRILTDPDHPFTMARFFDTHWFMNYRESD